MEKRVDIELDEETLKWAAIRAAKLGISRRKLISRGFMVFRKLVDSETLSLNPIEIINEFNRKE
jgi:hypothetical protein